MAHSTIVYEAWKKLRSRRQSSWHPADAEDLASETFLRIWQQRGTLKTAEAAVAWTWRFFHNVEREHLRRLARRRVVIPAGDDAQNTTLDPVCPTTRTPSSLVRQAERESEVRSRIATLNKVDREIFRMRFYDGLSFEEIAASLQMHVGAVRARYHRAIHALARDPKMRQLAEGLYR